MHADFGASLLVADRGSRALTVMLGRFDSLICHRVRPLIPETATPVGRHRMRAVFRISLAISNPWTSYFRNTMDAGKILCSAERRALIESLPAMRPKPPESDRSSTAQWNKRYQIFDQLVGITLDAIATNLSVEAEALQLALTALVDEHRAETGRVSADRRRTLDPPWQMAERAVEMLRTGGADRTG